MIMLFLIQSILGLNTSLIGSISWNRLYNHIYIIIWISKRKQKLILLTFLICVLMGFQAWLGKTVVDSV
jgi:hypothetical protein